MTYENWSIICVLNDSILWKSHWPPGYLVQINNISRYHSWSPSDCREWQPYAPSKANKQVQQTLILLNESCIAKYFLFRGAKVVKLALRVLKICGSEVKEFQVGSNVQILELT